MDKKRSLLNIGVSVIFKMVIIVAEIIVRRFLIRYIGNDINGLNSLYLSILDFLSIAELGVGSAITFCMYKPIVDGDKEKVAALYRLFNKLYLIISAVIVVASGIVMIFLPALAKDYEQANVNLYLTFSIMVASVVITYFFSAKTSLINAYKDNYITNAVFSVGRILQDAMQLAVLYFTGSFEWFLVCRIISSLLQWAATEIIARRKHRDIIKIKSRVDVETRREVTKNVKAMFMHKIGNILVNSADSVIISAFLGIVILGKYSNYTTIIISMTSVLTLCFSSLTSVVGHMYVEEGSETAQKYCEFFHTFNFILGVVFMLGYYAIADNLISILFDYNVTLSKSIVYVITLNYFIQFMRQAVMLFRDATGTFYNDRWKPLFESILNIVLSILFVCVFPEDYKVVGVIVATIITNIFICHIVEPHVLYKHALGISAKKYYIRNYTYIAVFAGLLTALHFCMVHMENEWLELLVNGCIAVALAVVPCLVAMLTNRNFLSYFKKMIKAVRHRHKKPSRTVNAIDTEK